MVAHQPLEMVGMVDAKYFCHLPRSEGRCGDPRGMVEKRPHHRPHHRAYSNGAPYVSGLLPAVSKRIIASFPFEYFGRIALAGVWNPTIFVVFFFL